jgi:biotin/methionine sulfoxide reductase
MRIAEMYASARICSFVTLFTIESGTDCFYRFCSSHFATPAPRTDSHCQHDAPAAIFILICRTRRWPFHHEEIAFLLKQSITSLNDNLHMSKKTRPSTTLNSSHWGAFTPLLQGKRLIGVQAFAKDPDPSPMLRSLPDAVHHRCRVLQPAVREGWLKQGPGRGNEGRGSDRFIAVSWERALNLVADELKRVLTAYGNSAIFAGSYGWASAGRFHHAKTQLQRFLVNIGGFTGSRETYSNAAAAIVAKRIVGYPGAAAGGTSWQSIAEHSEFVVMFGGAPLRNMQVTTGGMGEHTTRQWLMKAKAAGVTFCNISPIRADAPAFLDAEWLAPRPHSDTAIMLALAHTLIQERLHDEDFLARYCVGFDRFQDYLLGRVDGVVKNADWAAQLSELPAEVIRTLACRMARSRTMVLANWSLQRSDHGEQPFWAVIALAAMLGQIGLPGGGFGFGYGSMEGLAGVRPLAPVPTLPVGDNPVNSFIPVARIADMLLHPGQPLPYNGLNLFYPDIRLLYWCGGNPFHHHQDINRLLRAWRRPETIIVNDPWWTATARHADIVLPATTTLERNDIGASAHDRFILAMKQALAPVGQARNDFAIFSDLADRFGVREAFTAEKTEMELIRRLYDTARVQAGRWEMVWPDFDEFWERGFFEMPPTPQPFVLFEEFRRDPISHPLVTPSGRIEIFSQTIADFGYEDCPGHPVWLEPVEWLGSMKAQQYPLHLLTTQPSVRLHAQMDMGRVSQESKIAGREPIRIHPTDAAQRGIRNGDVVRVFNARGAILAGAVLSEDLRPGVVQIATGAWYDPQEPGVIGSLDKHGNPNVLTLDKGTSRLAQGSSAQTALVEVERYNGAPPKVTAFAPPQRQWKRDGKSQKSEDG